MTDYIPSGLASAFDRARSRYGVQGDMDAGAYVAEQVVGTSGVFAGVNQTGSDCLIIETSQGKAVPPLRLSGLYADYGQRCRIRVSDAVREVRACIISSAGAGEEMSSRRRLFSALCRSLVGTLRESPTDSEVAIELDRWASFFWRISQVRDPHEIGLIGELVAMASAPSVDIWVDAWHASPSDVTDFVFAEGRGRVEVKASRSERRVHSVSLAQSDTLIDDRSYLLSLRIVPGDDSVGDLIETVVGALSSRDTILGFWGKLTETAGASLDDLLQQRFDAGAARRSIGFFRMRDVPRLNVERPLPKGVSLVRFQVDLSEADMHGWTLLSE